MVRLGLMPIRIRDSLSAVQGHVASRLAAADAKADGLFNRSPGS
jgi:hypothetical protein